MGICGSKPKGCVGIKGKLNLQTKRRRQRRRRVKKAHASSHKNRVEPSHPLDSSYNNPAFQGSGDSWFDPDSIIDSEGVDEFYSVQDDVSQAGSLSNVVTPRFSNNVAPSNGLDSQPNSDDPQNEVRNLSLSEQADSGGKDDGRMLHGSGLLSNVFLPCLACDESLEPRRKSTNAVGTSTRRKVSLTPSFKWREGQDNPMLSSSRVLLKRPIAGSQITCSSLEKKMAESWSLVHPSVFKVRGRNFNRDKKKEFAANGAAYIPFGADVFLSHRKVDHIARFVELPAIDSSQEVPPILIVNLQIPLYPASIFQNDGDGAGMNFVFYFKLSENYSEDLPTHFQENFKSIIANETERIKGFPMDTIASFRERLKIMGRVVNVEELQLSAAERKLMHAYNEKPVLSRPQHEFHLGENYFEIDLDIHRFSFIARKGFETFQDRIKHCIFDFGLTIQGNKAEELPESMLCCIRLKEIDYTNYCLLSF